MASQSLYRKYRPRRFAEIVGQDHVTAALRHAVRSDRTGDPEQSRLGHAYLFSGPRGTGKTTTARLLAKALNCLALTEDGEPCGECENCAAIAAGTFYDLIELDAASNRTVDKARDLVSTVGTGLAPQSRRKVYVLDEVHMLTTDASNTLLKTLEEPPAHVLFVLATTDPQKVLPTIRSRTQHFEFTLLSREQLVAHLADVLGREGIENEPDSLERIARRAAGSVRDALTLLDQALALGAGALDAARIEAAFGASPFDKRLAVLEAVANEDPGGALRALEAVLVAGTEARFLADELLRTARDAFVLVMAAGRVPFEGPPEEEPRLRAVAENLGAPGLTRAIDLLGQTVVDMRGAAAPDPRLLLEVAVLRLARRESRTPVEALIERVERLERRLAEGGPVAAPVERSATPRTEPAGGALRAPGAALGAHLKAAAGAPPSDPDPGARAADERGLAPAPDPAAGRADEAAEPPADGAVGVELDFDEVVAAWPVAMAALSAPTRAAIQDAQPIGIEGSTITFGVPPLRYEAISGRFRSKAAEIKAALEPALGCVPRFVLRRHDFDAPGGLAPVSAGNGAACVAEPSERVEPAARDERSKRDGRDGRDGRSGTTDDIDEIDVADIASFEDAPSDGLPSPAARLQARFAAEVLEQRPRS